MGRKMSIFDRPVEELAYFNDIMNTLKKPGKTPVIFGCVDQQKAHFVSRVGRDFSFRLIITHTEIRARELYEDFRTVDGNVVYYPARDFIFYSADIHGNQLSRERLTAVKKILQGEPLTVITTIDGCAEKLVNKEVFEKYSITITVGEDIELDKLTAGLVDMGYERAYQTESPGQFAVRGGILDIFPLTEDNPYRIETWDTEVDSIKNFDVESQRSIENVNSLTVFPATELLVMDNLADGFGRLEKDSEEYAKSLEKSGQIVEAGRIRRNTEELKERLFVLQDYEGLESYINYFAPNTVSLIDYFDRRDTLIVLDEPHRLDEKLRVVMAEFSDSMSHRLMKAQIIPTQMEVLYSEAEIYAKIGSRYSIAISTLDCKPANFSAAGHYDIGAKGIGAYNKSFESLVSDIASWKKKKYRIIIATSSRTKAERLARDLMDNDVVAGFAKDTDTEVLPGEVVTVNARVRRGYEYPDIRYVVIAEDDIFGVATRKKRVKSAYKGQHISSFSELNNGDYVVHENHGIGIYRGIEKIEVDRIEKDYIKIEYASGGNLYILATQLDLIQKYADAEAKKPKLNKLGGQEWVRTKNRVKTAVSVVAEDLVRLYAVRSERKGFEYSEDTPWQREFEELFPYEETSDQLDAIADTKRDMESSKIMDRLICGDVGFGKTEIALRAAFKAIQDKKQVAYLVPTTILAKQHYSTFDTRMKEFGVNVQMLSRFCTPKEIKQTLADLKKGLVDVVVGTHRLLSQDVEFKDLGLLIVDEEQRFGVTHKEKIKKLKEDVDVITLTATPIPRTLHMSLIGIRDMSVLEEPPVDRLPIQTFVTEYDEEMVREAINREIARGGQVYYVYNRVQGIGEFTASVQKLVPDANVAFAHGQMSERELEQIMVDFVNGEIDVLVSTTIIETGLDIPNVNTIIIHDSNRFGLSQLYQLRGRVGRSGRMAYAFLMYKRDKILKETAEKRLSAIREFTELGSGVKIAMKDLEIRGAGNLLGEEQSGHMESVGYDLYCKLLNEAVAELKGVQINSGYETEIDLAVDAFVPATYIRNESVKLDVYKRVATISNDDELSDMEDELMDRFGEIPRSAISLMKVALIKSMAHDAFITDIKGNRKEIKIRMYPQAKINPAGIPPLLRAKGSAMRFTNGEVPYFTYYFSKDEIRNNDTYLDTIKGLVTEIGGLKEEQ